MLPALRCSSEGHCAKCTCLAYCQLLVQSLGQCWQPLVSGVLSPRRCRRSGCICHVIRLQFTQLSCGTLPLLVQLLWSHENSARGVVTSRVQLKHGVISSSAAGLSWAYMRSHAVITLRGGPGV